MTTAADRRWFEAVASLETCSLCGRYGVQVAHRNEGRAIVITHDRLVRAGKVRLA